MTDRMPIQMLMRDGEAYVNVNELAFFLRQIASDEDEEANIFLIAQVIEDLPKVEEG